MTKNARFRLALVVATIAVCVTTLGRSLQASSSMRNGNPFEDTVTGSEPGEVHWTYYETTLGATSCTTPGVAGCDNGGNGDNILRLINPNGNANPSFGPIGEVCAMIYVFDDAQEMGECCGCPLSPADFENFSIEHDLTSNFIFGRNPDATKVGAIAVVAANMDVAYVGNGSSSNGHNCANTQSAACNGGCDPTEIPGYAVSSDNLLGSILHNQTAVTGPLSVSGLTEIPLSDDAGGDPKNLNYLENECGVLVGGGSGAGVCHCPEIPPAPTVTTPLCVGPAAGGPSMSSSDASGMTSLQVTTPNSTQQGDFLLTVVALETAPGHKDAANSTITPPGGWTERSFTTAGTDLAVGIFTKLAASGDANGGASYTWTFDDAYRASIEVENYGTISGIPAGFGPTCSPSTQSRNITAPSLTTVPSNALDVAIWVSASNQVPVPPIGYASCFQAGVVPSGGSVGPLPAISTLAIPGSGTMIGDQVATIPLPADNIGCQINLSP